MSLQFSEWEEGIYFDDRSDSALTAYYKSTITDFSEKMFVYLYPKYVDREGFVWYVYWEDPQIDRLYMKFYTLPSPTKDIDVVKQHIDNFLVRISGLAAFL
jgi:hypothetical protein